MRYRGASIVRHTSNGSQTANALAILFIEDSTSARCRPFNDAYMMFAQEYTTAAFPSADPERKNAKNLRPRGTPYHIARTIPQKMLMIAIIMISVLSVFGLASDTDCVE